MSVAYVTIDRCYWSSLRLLRSKSDDELAGIETRSNPNDESYDAPALLAEDVILFPEMEVSITVKESKNIVAVAQALREHSLVVLIPAAGPEGVAGSIGTLVLVQTTLPVRGEGAQILSRGLWRVRVEQVLKVNSYMRVRFTRAGASEDEMESATEPSTMEAVFGQIDEFVRLIPGIPPEIITFLKSIKKPGKLADMCGYSPFFTFEQRRDLLMTLDPEERLTKVSRLFAGQLDDLRRMARIKTIPECATCMDLADKAFEAEPNRRGYVAREYLDHVVREHADELLVLLAEKYGPIFLKRRELK